MSCDVLRLYAKFKSVPAFLDSLAQISNVILVIRTLRSSALSVSFVSDDCTSLANFSAPLLRSVSRARSDSNTDVFSLRVTHSSDKSPT